MDGTLLAGMVAAMGGIGVLRWSWWLGHRSRAANLGGWGLLLAGCWIGGWVAGAWGVAVVSLVAMALAAVLLGWAAATAPAARGKAADRRNKALSLAAEPPRPGGRVLTFAVVVVGGFAAALALTIGLRAGAIALGWSAANANAAALMCVPLAWSVLATVLLMTRSRRAQAIALAVCSLPLLPALITGS